MGEKGKDGEVLVVLYAGPEKTGEMSGMLAEGRFDASALVGPMKGKTIAELETEMGKGVLVVNVHTKGNADGEIRGQIH
jgi:hypothetical protein